MMSDIKRNTNVFIIKKGEHYMYVYFDVTRRGLMKYEQCKQESQHNSKQKDKRHKVSSKNLKMLYCVEHIYMKYVYIYIVS